MITVVASPREGHFMAGPGDGVQQVSFRLDAVNRRMLPVN
jgi:hypothetical protein